MAEQNDNFNSGFDDDSLSDEEKFFEEFRKEEEQKQDEEEEELSADNASDDLTQNLWMVSFADLMTILMIFFLSLFGYAYSGANAHYEKTMMALQKDVATKNEKVVLETKEKEADVAVHIETFIKDKDLSKYAKVETNAQRVKISLSNPILFDSGSAVLKKEAIPTLKEIANLIKPLKNDVIVEGHTDNVPISSKKFRSNFELSASRAFSVINYFIAAEEIPPERFSAFGYGEFKPVSSNNTEEGRGKNRRIEINIMRKT